MINVGRNYDHLKEDFLRLYPNEENITIANRLSISVHQVRRLATKWKIHKSSEFLDRKRLLTRVGQQKYFSNKIKPILPTKEQLSIILGSLLGDASLSCAPRSKNYSYKEHFSSHQFEYRKWKMEKLADLGFHITKSHHLYSYSHPFFTELHHLFYHEGKKVVPKILLPFMDHPLLLATLYLDDGSLRLSITKKNKKIFLHPNLAIYSQSFSEGDNIALMTHFNQYFGTSFVLNKRKDGTGFILKLNKERDVRYFLNIIRPFVKDIPNVAYKTDLDHRLNLEISRLKNLYPDHVILPSSSSRNKPYTEDEIEKLISLRKLGKSWNEIANSLNRTYWSVIYKARGLEIN